MNEVIKSIPSKIVVIASLPLSFYFLANSFIVNGEI